MPDFIIDESLGVRTLVMHGEWSERVAAAINDEDCKGLVVNEWQGYRGRDLAFFDSGLANITHLSILMSEVRALESLSSLHSLKSLSVQIPDCPPIPVDDLIDLEDLTIIWSDSLESCLRQRRIKSLTIVGYTAQDLRFIRHREELRRLCLIQPRLKSFVGLSELVACRELDLRSCKIPIPSESFAYLQNLRTLHLRSMRLSGSMQWICELPCLEELYLINCGCVDSLRYLEGSTIIKCLGVDGTTDVSDGEFQFINTLSNLKRLFVKRRRHYSPTKNRL